LRRKTRMMPMVFGEAIDCRLCSQLINQFVPYCPASLGCSRICL